MSLECLEALNSKYAQRNAVNSLLRFLASENVSIEYVKTCIKSGDGRKSFEILMDQFGMHLAFSVGENGKTLARNTVMTYFRQAKTWLFKEFSPMEVVSTDPPHRKMATTLEKYCLKRESGGIIKKATACTTNDLRLLNRYLYANATTAAAYQDAALLCLLWQVFGRAPDLTLVQKQNLSVSANNVVFIRLIRMKTSEEQGLSLFPDDSYVTCPIHAAALALMMQIAPSPRLIDQLPHPGTQGPIHVAPAIPLAELLEHGPSTLPAEDNKRGSKQESVLGIHNYVNRLLARVSDAAGVTSDLSSHTFRRGGAQHANDDAQLSAQWIFDRGAWNLSTTNKAFAYVFNTTAEDQTVARVLSGWDSKDTVQTTNLNVFDSTTRDKISELQARVFASCSKHQDTSFNTKQQVLDVFLAHLLKHYPTMKQLHPEGPAVRRLEERVLSAGYSLGDLLSWASILLSITACAQHKQDKQAHKQVPERSDLEMHQAAVIEQLLQVNKSLAETLLDRIEAIESINSQQNRQRAGADEDEIPYTREPRLWGSSGNRQKKSLSNQVVAYMRLFFDHGFHLDPDQDNYRDRARQLGHAAELSIVEFLRAHGIISLGAGAVLKYMRELHRSGALNARIVRCRAQIATGRIIDPAPRHAQDILTTV